VPGNSKFELRHLRYVIAAAEHGSFRRAAIALNIQVSAISRRIRDVEDEVGAALFIRHHCGVSLTYAGEQFVDRVRLAINQIRDAAHDVGAIGRAEDGVVRIGLFSSLASGFLAELFQAYDANHVGVRLDFFEGGLSDHLSAIRQYRLDVAFLTGTRSVDGCDTAHLWNERVYVAMSESDELAGREEIEWSDLRHRHFIVSEVQPGPEIQDCLIQHFAKLGHRPSIERQAVYRDMLMQIVAGGRGLTLTSEATTAAPVPGIVYRPLAGEVLPFCAVWSPKNDNPAFRRLLSLARTKSKQCAAHQRVNGFANPSEGLADHREPPSAAPSQSLCPSP
jgi:DNA-binding transcriptional LysR family regulator